jgi:hypothetical protein
MFHLIRREFLRDRAHDVIATFNYTNRIGRDNPNVAMIY